MINAMKNKLSNKTSVRNILIGIYILVILAFSATSKADMNIMPIFTNQKQVVAKVFVGTMMKNPEDSTYNLFVSRSEFYQLKSNINLDKFEGKDVAVKGVKIAYKSGPSYSTEQQHVQYATDDEAQTLQQELPASTIVVLEINEVTN